MMFYQFSQPNSHTIQKWQSSILTLYPVASKFFVIEKANDNSPAAINGRLLNVIFTLIHSLSAWVSVNWFHRYSVFLKVSA